MRKYPLTVLSIALCVLNSIATPTARPDATSGTLLLSVDATQAPRGTLHARIEIPAKPGPLTLYYPKWIPGAFSSGPSTTSQLAVTARLRLPPGWKYGTALETTTETHGEIAFAPVSLTTLVDSPVLAGARHCRRYDFLLTLSDGAVHFGLEHHESSDDHLHERALVDEQLRKATADRPTRAGVAGEAPAGEGPC